MKQVIIGATMVFSSVFALPSSAALALDMACDSPSPALLRLGDTYYDLAPETAIDAEDIRKLEQFYQQLHGRWSGQLVDTFCIGSGESARFKHKTYQLDNARGSSLADGLFTIRTDKNLIEARDGSSRRRVISTTPGARIDFFPATELSSLYFVDSNTIETSARFRQNNRVSTAGRRITTLRERQDTLTLTGNTLQIETRFYSNGYFTGRETVVLTRRRNSDS